MATDDDDDDVNTDENDDFDEDEPLPQRMVRTAFSHKAITGDPSPIVDMMALAAPNSCNFWVEVAEELHARSEHYEALDAWLKAKALASQPDNSFDVMDMAKTLWTVSDFGDDAYLGEAAANAYADAKEWEAYLTILNEIGASRDRMLKAFWKVLATGTKLDFDGDWEIDGTCVGDIEYADLTTWSRLANAHLLLGDLSKAFEAWAMMARSEDVDYVLHAAIPCLIELARTTGLHEDDYIPPR